MCIMNAKQKPTSELLFIIILLLLFISGRILLVKRHGKLKTKCKIKTANLLHKKAHYTI